MVREKATGEIVGLCGFLVFSALRPEPQLIYALYERFAGRGYATEMSRAVIADAASRGGFDEVYAGVDEPNLASRRVLEKLGFETIATLPGHFGKSFLLKLVGLVMPLRASDEEQAQGVDVLYHGEEAYPTGEGAILVTPEPGDGDSDRPVASPAGAS